MDMVIEINNLTEEEFKLLAETLDIMATFMSEKRQYVNERRHIGFLNNATEKFIDNMASVQFKALDLWVDEYDTN